MSGRLLAIGDIHGSSQALQTLAEFAEITPEDTLITLGDYVDRGPDTRGVINWLISRHRQGETISLRGNHEIMMMAARNTFLAFADWMMHGGRQALASYDDEDPGDRVKSHFAHDFGKAHLLDEIPEEHWQFLEATLPYYETETHIFVHASLKHDLPLDQQPAEALFWDRLFDAQPHQSGKTMVCGHTPQFGGRPSHCGFAICIDTSPANRGWLTCLDVETERYWQANQKGKTRVGQLKATAVT